jgi:hypothetical protein
MSLKELQGKLCKSNTDSCHEGFHTENGRQSRHRHPHRKEALTSHLADGTLMIFHSASANRMPLLDNGHVYWSQ